MGRTPYIVETPFPPYIQDISPRKWHLGTEENFPHKRGTLIRIVEILSRGKSWEVETVLWSDIESDIILLLGSIMAASKVSYSLIFGSPHFSSASFQPFFQAMAKAKPRIHRKFLAAFTRCEVCLTREKLFLLEFLFPHVGCTMKYTIMAPRKGENPWDLNALLDQYVARMFPSLRLSKVKSWTSRAARLEDRMTDRNVFILDAYMRY